MSSCFNENKRSLHSHHQCHVLCHRAASLLGRPMCLNLEGSQALNCLWWIELMICLPPNQILQWCGLKGLYTTSKILSLNSSECQGIMKSKLTIFTFHIQVDILILIDGSRTSIRIFQTIMRLYFLHFLVRLLSQLQTHACWTWTWKTDLRGSLKWL